LVRRSPIIVGIPDFSCHSSNTASLSIPCY
jgi:hypothetical protein